MYKLANNLLLIATMLIIFVGGGIILNIIPADSPIIAPSTVISLFLVGVGAGLKRKHKK